MIAFDDSHNKTHHTLADLVKFGHLDYYPGPDGTIIVKASLCVEDKHLKKTPHGTFLPDLSKVILEGDFTCSGLGLASLEGAPRKVTGRFDCSENHLPSLLGAPQEVGGNFVCINNPDLTDYTGIPRRVGGDVICTHTPADPSQLGNLEEVGGLIRGDHGAFSLADAKQRLRETDWAAQNPPGTRLVRTRTPS